MIVDIIIRTALTPGDIGRLIEFHGVAFDEDPVHFGLKFEAHVARTLAEFILDNNADGRIWIAERGGDLVGCAAMVKRGDRGQLRWILTSPDVRGQGLGRKLVAMAMDYAAAEDFSEVFLETTHGLEASMAIYRKLGFIIVNEEVIPLWGYPQSVLTMVKKLR